MTPNTKDYILLVKIPRLGEKDATVKLTAKQAKYLLLEGKIKLKDAASSKTKAKA